MNVQDEDTSVLYNSCGTCVSLHGILSYGRRGTTRVVISKLLNVFFCFFDRASDCTTIVRVHIERFMYTIFRSVLLRTL